MKLKNILDKDDGLLKAGFLFMVSVSLGNALSYLYHLLVARKLGPEQYGVLGSLFAIIYLVYFTSQTFNRIIAKFSAELDGKGNRYMLLVQKSFFKICSYGLIFLVIYIAASPLIAKFLKLDSVFELIFVGIIAYLMLITSVFTGYLNGIQSFGWQNASSFFTIFFKFCFGVFLVYLGWNLFGALLGVFLGALAGLLIAFYPLRDLFSKIEKTKFDFKRIYVYSVPVIFSSIFPVLLFTIDLILARHFLPDKAGYYASTGLVAKVIWYGSGFFVPAVFPKFVSYFTKKKDARKLLAKSFAYTSITAFIGCAFLFIMPKFIINLLYGAEYIEAAGFLGFMGLGMAFFSVTQLLIAYNLAAERFGFIWFLVFGFVFEVIAILLFHANLMQIAIIFLLANFISLLCMLFCTFRKLSF